MVTVSDMLRMKISLCWKHIPPSWTVVSSRVRQLYVHNTFYSMFLLYMLVGYLPSPMIYLP